MTGAEHVEKALELLADATTGEGFIGSNPDNANTIAAAQVHAILALADAQRRATEALRKANR